MSPELIKLLLQIGLQAYQSLAALKTEDPVAFEAALQKIGSDHASMFSRLEAAAAP